MKEIFLNDDDYAALIAALVAIKDGPFSGSKESAIKIALGEIGNIWPTSIRGDAIRAAVEDSERAMMRM